MGPSWLKQLVLVRAPSRFHPRIPTNVTLAAAAAIGVSARRGVHQKRKREKEFMRGPEAVNMGGSQQTGVDANGNARKSASIRGLIGACSGNLVEWFDFFVYAYTAIYFASSFFPSGNQTSQLLATAGIFAVGFFMRPIGGWLFGWIADTRGRKTSMIISVIIMSLGSFMIAVLPTYQTIGIAAPILLLTARLLQGLSVGAEYGTGATYISEVSTPGRRGFFGS